MPKASQGSIRIGVGGWTFEPWRTTFYPDKLPQKRELEYASSKLTSIEINGTFYGSQKPESFVKWRDETPDGFVFSVKAPRFATNRRVLSEAGSSIDRFFASGVMLLGDKLGAINWQFAPTKAFDAADFEGFLKLLPKEVEGHAIRNVVEVRHDSFNDPDFVALTRLYGVGIVLAADSKYVQIADRTAPFVYARIMGAVEAEPLGYSAAALDLWAEHARQLAAGKVPDGLKTVAAHAKTKTATDVYLYFISGDKVRNPAAAMALIERLKA